LLSYESIKQNSDDDGGGDDGADADDERVGVGNNDDGVGDDYDGGNVAGGDGMCVLGLFSVRACMGMLFISFIFHQHDTV